MARSIQTIYDEIVLEKQNQSSLTALTPINDTSTQLLNDVNSSSKVALWRLWAWTTACAIHSHELFFDAFLAEAEVIAQRAEVGTPRWYQQQVFKFQFGDNLVFLNQKYQYAVIDESKKIVKRCAIIERADGVVLAKVAKVNSAGVVEPLLNTELVALIGYGAKIKFAGTKLGFISQSADVINLNYNILHDAIIPSNVIQNAVKIAVENYFSTLPFDGKVVITYLTDAIQKVTGVLEPRFITASGTPQGGQVKSFVYDYESEAGHVVAVTNFINNFTFTPITQA